MTDTVGLRADCQMRATDEVRRSVARPGLDPGGGGQKTFTDSGSGLHSAFRACLGAVNGVLSHNVGLDEQASRFSFVFIRKCFVEKG